MIELSIPQIGDESKTAKDLVFTILSIEHPLSIIELTKKIQEKYNASLTYQAIRKAVDHLYSQKVLDKERKRYSLNKNWILNLKSFFDKLLTNYEGKTSFKLFNPEFAKEDYALYTFGNLFDLDNFWGDAMWYWSDHVKENEPKEFLGYSHYSWWFLINLGRETKLFDHFKEKEVNSHVIFFKNLPLNNWASKLYKGSGVKTIIKQDKNIDENLGLNILGDTIIQVKYPEKIIKKLKRFYEKYKNIQKISLKEITEIAHESSEIRFIMFKNPTIAKNLRETYLKYF